jgi:hypothetical protein
MLVAVGSGIGTGATVGVGDGVRAGVWFAFGVDTAAEHPQAARTNTAATAAPRQQNILPSSI